eukprot:m.101200 g.101200  ORF g.101200 m.101200 type:complete len:542 (+) comp8779_c0_seq1:27-1652(+)
MAAPARPGGATAAGGIGVLHLNPIFAGSRPAEDLSASAHVDGPPGLQGFQAVSTEAWAAQAPLPAQQQQAAWSKSVYEVAGAWDSSVYSGETDADTMFTTVPVGPWLTSSSSPAYAQPAPTTLYDSPRAVGSVHADSSQSPSTGASTAQPATELNTWGSAGPTARHEPNRFMKARFAPSRRGTPRQRVIAAAIVVVVIVIIVAVAAALASSSSSSRSSQAASGASTTISMLATAASSTGAANTTSSLHFTSTTVGMTSFVSVQSTATPTSVPASSTSTASGTPAGPSTPPTASSTFAGSSTPITPAGPSTPPAASSTSLGPSTPSSTSAVSSTPSSSDSTAPLFTASNLSCSPAEVETGWSGLQNCSIFNGTIDLSLWTIVDPAAFQSLSIVTGSFIIRSLNLTSLTLPRLAEIGGTLSVSGSSSLASLSLPMLNHVAGSVLINTFTQSINLAAVGTRRLAITALFNSCTSPLSALHSLPLLVSTARLPAPPHLPPTRPSRLGRPTPAQCRSTADARALPALRVARVPAPPPARITARVCL